MKKSISIILIAIIFLNTLLSSRVYAETTPSTGQPTPATTTDNKPEENKDDKDSSSTSSVFESQDFDTVTLFGLNDGMNLISDGKADVNGKSYQLNETGSFFKTIGRGIIQIFCLIPQTINLCLSLVVQPYLKDTAKSDEFHWYSIQDVVYGKINLFDINFFDLSKKGENDVNAIIKEQVVNWYYILRSVALIANLLVLVYVGIRMAISTVASDQAKYKEMLISWLTSFIIIFALPYLLMFIFEMANAFLALVQQAAPKENLDTIILESVYGDINKNDVTATFWAGITLFMLTYFNIVFFGRYIFRFLKIAFLIIISPLITVMYALGKKDAYKGWLSDLIGAIFMQVVHMTVYSLFLFSTAEIVKAVPILITAFFMAMEKGEKIFNYIFGLKQQ